MWHPSSGNKKMKSFKEFHQLDEIGNHFSNLSEVPKKKKPKLVNPDVCESAKHDSMDPPAVIVMKRKSIRQFPNNQRVALYYADKINQYVTVPYTSSQWSKGPVDESMDIDE